MKHPSMWTRLMIGTGIAVTMVLAVSMVFIFQAVARMMRREVRAQLLESAAILAKSSELEPAGVVYEWHEAIQSGSATGVPGYFQFWDCRSGRSVGSPALAGASLERFHGALDETVLRPITLPDGRPALAAGLLHLPFLDDDGRESMARSGALLKPADFPQVLVCARETTTLDQKLARVRRHFLRAGAATLAAIWITTALVIRRTLRPLNHLAGRLEERSRQDSGPLPAIPPDLPRELTGLAYAFNRTLERAETGRERERQFALHAAHELRTPVAGIRATLEQAVRLPREADDLRARIRSALHLAAGMSETIDSLMRLARIRGGSEKAIRKPFDPAAVFDELLDEASGTLVERRFALRREGPRRGIAAEGDPDLFRVVLVILIDNAVRHSPEGSEIDAVFMDEVGRFTIRLANPAPGIRSSELPGLFELFQRGAAQQSTGGAGLGLSLAREITWLLGGTISLRLEDPSLLVVELLFPR